MPRSCLLFFVLLSGVYTYANAATPNNVAFYYGREAPIGALYAYDWVVLQQDQASDARIDLLRKGGTQPLSYISIGEIAKSHHYFREIQEHWKLGRNEAWKSVVLDLRLPDVRQFILDQLIAPAMARGFSGLFMDTLDSHLLTPQGKAQPDAFADGQAALLENIRNRWPDARIIINRGFHLPEASHALVDALAFESWRAGYLAGQNQYISVPDQDRAWLAQQLNHWRTRHPEVPLIAIDYLHDGDMAPEHAAQLRAEGFIPYVTNGALNRLGPTEPHTVKRHILVVHDQAPGGMDQSAAHRRLGIILERLGLVPVYRSAREPHPREPMDDRYAGVVVWWETGNRSTGFCQWLAGQQSPALPVVTFGLSPLQPACQSLMGSRRLVAPETPLAFGERNESVARYEGGRLPVSPLSPLPAMISGNAWITATGSDGASYHPVYTFAQGGTAVAPFVLETGPEDQAFWLFDPFRFLSEALHLNPFPAADSTTESGRRILTAHIDGDGFVSRAELPGSPMSAAVILDRILSRFPIPHTVSVIEAETSPEGLYPASSNEAEALARRLFQLDNVEIASHSYSHPFFWRVLEGGSAPSQENTLYGYALNIPGYTATLAREIAGSVNYINQQLAPPGKPVSVFLWTGDARPGEKALARVRELGLININGGDTHPLPYNSELAGVWPDARPVGDELQVYAPVMNENVYTNLWTGPFYGFRNVIDSFRVLEEKGRLKPMGIYYHFYSGTKPESLSALEEVYRYALSQPVIPLHLSDYARRVQAQYYSALTVTGDGGFRWRGLQVPSTVRVGLNQYPDLQRSQGVAGYRDVNGQRFVHLTGPNATLYLSQAPVTGPYIESANAIMTDWQREKQEGTWHLQAELRGYQPIEIVIAGAERCTVQNDMPMTQTRRSGNLVLSSPGAHQVSLNLECR